MKQKTKQRPRFPGAVEEVREAVQDNYMDSTLERIHRLKQHRGLITGYEGVRSRLSHIEK